MGGRAIPLATTEPGGDDTDLLPVRALIGDARIVALGEATHGTHEFFTVKHRLIAFLVAELGFTTLAIEADWAAAVPLDHWVRTGIGDPVALLAKLHMWTWNTHEMLSLLYWLRAYNKRRGVAPSIGFVGFDSQNPTLAMEQVLSFMQKVDHHLVEYFKDCYSVFRSYADIPLDYEYADSRIKERCQRDIQTCYKILLDHQIAYTFATSPPIFAHVLQSARAIMQAEDILSSSQQALNVRDGYMAENISLLLQNAVPETKIILWAHNEHLGTTPYGAVPQAIPSMGMYLRLHFGDQLVTCGFTFYQGMCNAICRRRLSSIRIPPPLTDSHEASLFAYGMSQMLIDLRGDVADATFPAVLSEPRPLRRIGATYNDTMPEFYFAPVSLPQKFDLLVYLRDTSATKLLPPWAPAQQLLQGETTLPTQPVNLDLREDLLGWMLTDYQQYQLAINRHVTRSDWNIATLCSAAEDKNLSASMLQTFSARLYAGYSVCYAADIQAEGVEQTATLWLRVDMPDGSEVHHSAPVSGTTPWHQHRIDVDVPASAIRIACGALLHGQGQIRLRNLCFTNMTITSS